MNKARATHFVVFFDRDCNLCRFAIHTILKWDRRGIVKFSPLQSPYAQLALTKHHRNTNKLESMLFLENGVLYQKSAAALRICKYLGGPFPLLQIFLICPQYLRDLIYEFIAKNRYQLSRTLHPIPINEEGERFLVERNVGLV